MSARGATLAVALAGLAGAAPASAETLAVMPVKLLDTSHEVRDQTAEHAQRLAMVGEALAADMDGAGPYTATVLIGRGAVAAACPARPRPA